MRKNRLFYSSLIIVLGILLFFFSNPFLLCAMVILVLMAFFAAVLLHGDARIMRIHLQVRSGTEKGKELPLVFQIENGRRLHVTGTIMIRMKISYEMLQKTETVEIAFPAEGNRSGYEHLFLTEQCGDIRFSCDQVQIGDVLNLFHLKIRPFQEVYTTVYPEKLPIQVQLSRTAIGAYRDNGLVQNRKGDDPSEIFDLRDYIPGDDIRSIHWKLSGKLDHLIFRQASDPFHYHVVLLPDIGLMQEGEQVPLTELNHAIAVNAAVAEQLMEQGCDFCMLIPSGTGLEICEIRSQKDVEKVIGQWLGVRLQERAGLLLQYFLMEHLDRYFSKLIIVSTGRYKQDLEVLAGRVSITLICAVSGEKFATADLSDHFREIHIPCDQDNTQEYHILC